MFSFLAFHKGPILTGLMIPLSYIPFPPYGIFFCFIPLWLFALRQTQLKPLLVGGWICQIFVTLGGGNWIAYTIEEFGGFSRPVAWGLFALFAAGANLQIPLSLLLWFWGYKLWLKLLPRSKTLPFLGKEILLVGASATLMIYFPNLFKWHLGYTLFYARWPLFQTAEIWGFSFLNTLILLSNLLFLFLFKNLKQKLQQQNIPLLQNPLNKKTWLKLKQPLLHPLTGGLLLLWTAAFLTLNLWGLYLKHRWPDDSHTAYALLVQPHIKPLPTSGSKRGSRRNQAQYQINTLWEGTGKGLKNFPHSVDFVLWPEGSYPYTIKDPPAPSTGFQRVGQAAQYFKTPIIVSAIRKQPAGHSNSIFIFNPQGHWAAPPYDKVHLIAFGEYWPASIRWIPFMDRVYPHFGHSFLRGREESSVISLPPLSLGFQICYEGLFDHFSRKLIHQGANILINTSNDRWFHKWQQPYQHLYMTLARGIEVRRPVVRGTNSGFSAVMSAKGDLLYRSTLWETSQQVQAIPYRTQPINTVFSSWGYYINLTALLLFFLWPLLWSLILSKKQAIPSLIKS